MTSKQMRIEGMTCAHCETTIAKALTGARAANVSANWRQGRATFEAEDIDDQRLQAAVERVGYKVTSIEDIERSRSTVGARAAGPRHDYDLVVIGSGSAA